MLWPEDMPPHALVILSDADDLVPSPLVAKHISDAHTTATVMYHPTAGHGGFLVDLPWQRQMVQVGFSATYSQLSSLSTKSRKACSSLFMNRIYQLPTVTLD
jgi:hypothetical protein